MKVWVIYGGDYEMRIEGIAESLEDGIRFLKDKYKPPYRVKWGDNPKEDGDSLTAEFEFVMGYSSAHTEEFTFEEVTVIGSTEAERRRGVMDGSKNH